MIYKYEHCEPEKEGRNRAQSLRHLLAADELGELLLLAEALAMHGLGGRVPPPGRARTGRPVEETLREQEPRVGVDAIDVSPMSVGQPLDVRVDLTLEPLDQF